MVAFSSVAFFSSITGDWQAIQEEHNVGAALVLAFAHGELVHRHPVVVVRILEIHDADRRQPPMNRPGG